MAVELLHHVQLAMPAGGERRARNFFQDLLGLQEVPKPVDSGRRAGCWFGRGAVYPHLGMESDFRSARTALPAVMVPDPGALATPLAAGYDCHGDRELPVFECLFVCAAVGNCVALIAPGAGLS